MRRHLTEKKAALQKRLGEINSALAEAGGQQAPADQRVAPPMPAPAPQEASGRSGWRKMSAEGRARIAAAQKARWAKTRKGQPPAPTKASAAVDSSEKPKRQMSAAGRKKIAEAARRRWAAAKAAGKNAL